MMNSADRLIGNMGGALIAGARECIAARPRRTVAEVHGTIGDAPRLEQLGEDVFKPERAHG